MTWYEITYMSQEFKDIGNDAQQQKHGEHTWEYILRLFVQRGHNIVDLTEFIVLECSLEILDCMFKFSTNPSLKLGFKDGLHFMKNVC